MLVGRQLLLEVVVMVEVKGAQQHHRVGAADGSVHFIFAIFPQLLIQGQLLALGLVVLLISEVIKTPQGDGVFGELVIEVADGQLVIACPPPLLLGVQVESIHKDSVIHDLTHIVVQQIRLSLRLKLTSSDEGG